MDDSSHQQVEAIDPPQDPEHQAAHQGVDADPGVGGFGKWGPLTMQIQEWEGLSQTIM
jgi:hypothetical protein